MTAAKLPSPKAHRVLQFIHTELSLSRRSLRWLAATSGVSYNTLKEAMRNESNISLRSAEAALNALGYSLKPTPIFDMGSVGKKRTRRVPMEVGE